MTRIIRLTWIGFVIFTAVLLGCRQNESVDQNGAGDGETAVSPPEATTAVLSTAGAAGAESPVNFQSLQAEIESAEALWTSQNIQKYHIEVRHVRPNWNTQIIDIIVESGDVIEANQTCYPERTCVIQDVDPQNMTIENMFSIARQVVALTDLNPEANFNKTYGFPTYVSYDDASWVLNGFKLIEPAP